jgi:general secretion pathway protein F/type IV pilus assembly protein PilC
MPFPRRTLAAWYGQLADQLEAGQPLAEALTEAPGRLRPVGTRMAAQISAGGSVHDALRAAGRALSETERLTLSSAADAGRLPAMLRSLAARHQTVARAQWKIVVACAYPLALLHLGLLLRPLTRMVDWNTGFHGSPIAYLLGVATSLLPLWALIAGVVVLARRQSRALYRLGLLLPGIRQYLRCQAISDVSFALGSWISAGVPIGDAWAATSVVTRLPSLAAAGMGLSRVVDRGERPGVHLDEWPVLPADWRAQYRTGEMTGQLDTALARLADAWQDRAGRALTLVMLLYPALVFLAVSMATALQIFGFYGNYLKTLEKLAE